MNKFLKILVFAAVGGMILTGCCNKQDESKNECQMMKHQPLTQKWDKVFPKSDKVEHSKVVFHNRYGIELVADMYLPKGMEGKLPAIAVCGPFGAVKEQVSGLYAQHMAERGFVTLAFDPSYTGESGGEPRRTASPDINTEDILAAVDYFTTLDCVDTGHIGVIGICGFGGMAVNAAVLDPRIKATVTVSMYDISRSYTNGYQDAHNNAEYRNIDRRAFADMRTQIASTGDYGRRGGIPKPEQLSDDTPQFYKDYADYYSTPRGYHSRSGASTDGWNLIGTQSFLNQPLLCYADEIESPVLLIHGEKAHSLYLSETTFEKMTGRKCDGKSMTVGNKEIMIIPGAVHIDFYDDRAGVIPYDKIEQFLRGN